MKALLLLCAAFAFAAAAPYGGWLTVEGYGMHAPCAFAVATVGYTVAYCGFDWSPTKATLFGLGVATVAIVGKEAADQINYGGWSWSDATWGGIGAVTSVVVTNLLVTWARDRAKSSWW